MGLQTFNQGTSQSFFTDLPTLSPVGPAMLALTGNTYFVNSSSSAALDSAGTRGSGPLAPFKTLNFALTQVIPNNGDVIYVLPGHVETVNAASGLNFASGTCDGVTVLFMGSGADRAQVNFVTATTAQMVIAANNVSIFGMRCVCAIDALAAAISITGSDCTLSNIEYFDGTAILTTIQVITTNAAKRLTINGYTYYQGTAGTSQTEAIRIVGGANHRLTNLNISGSFSTANVNNVTTATTDFVGQGWYLKNPLTTAAGVPTTAFVSTSTFLNPDVGPTSGNNEYSIAKTLALPQGATAVAFTIAGGPVEVIELGGYITTVIGAVANVTKLNWNPALGGTATDLTTGVDLNAAAAGDLYVLATSFATAAVLVTTGIQTAAQYAAAQLVRFVAAPGTIRVICAGSDGGTGRVQWYMRYKPLAQGVSVT